MKKKSKPKFRRQEWFQAKRLGEKWRQPRGLDSKMRLCRKGKPAMPSIGYKSPKEIRGLHPSGLAEVMVRNPKELEKIDPKKYVARITSAVGRRKRDAVIKRAQELKIRVVNPRGVKVETEHAKKTSS
jgi:large subunit ribosomal protein L32e